MAVLLDAKGCLTDAGQAALESARPGQAPRELAAHVASCSRCQTRLLAGGRLALVVRKRKTPPPRWRLLAVLAAAVLLVLTAYVTLSRFAP